MSLIKNWKPRSLASHVRAYRCGVKPAARATLRGAAVVVLCADAILISCPRVAAQISPGPLSPAHATFDKVTKCQTCHQLSGRGFKCLDCHTEIKRRIEQGLGFHSRAYKRSPGGEDCTRCHVEHRGQKAPLIPLDRKNFDHLARIGFALEGRHREQKCENCHNATKIAASARSEIKLKDLNRSFLGLRRECSSCHADAHQNQLGIRCNDCHTPAAWKPAPGFNHARTPFPLAGMHQQVPCEKCHARSSAAQAGVMQVESAGANPGAVAKVRLFKGLSFNACQSCHQDPHHNAFQDVQINRKCEGCHNTGGWKKNRSAAVFNHDTTKYRLVGKHTQVDCEKCHKRGDFRRPVAHERCRDCHEDPHSGQFASRPAGSDCSACHSPNNFKPALFDREAHRHTAFPLEGKHSTLRCQLCHQPAGRNAHYKTGKLRCSECHAEPHGGEFARQPFNNQCDTCHTAAGFETTTFSIERHARTQFPLAGGHGKVPCEKCHTPLLAPSSEVAQVTSHQPLTEPFLAGADKPEYARARRRYHFASPTCKTCHADLHALDPKLGYSCETCHVPDNKWKALRPFDHSRTGFKLEGAHMDGAQPVACIGCHKSSALADGGKAGTVPSFSRAPNQCSRCHVDKDPHGGQFSSPDDRQRDCSTCHNAAAWRAAGGFDHDTTPFPLYDHREVLCEKCHKDWSEINGKAFRVYRGTSAACQKCH